MEEPCARPPLEGPRPQLPPGLFHLALADLGRLHDRELQALREQLEDGRGRGGDSELLSAERRPASEELVSPVASASAALRESASLRPWQRGQRSVAWGGPLAGKINGSAQRVTQATQANSRGRWEGNSFYGSSLQMAASRKNADVEVLMNGWKRGRSSQVSTLNSLQESRAWKLKFGACRTLVGLQAFDALCSLMIVGNAVLMGVAADWRVRNYGEELPQKLQLLDRLFTCWFLLELLLRVCGYGLEFFVHAKLWSWNLFDFCVVAADVVIMLIDVSSPEEASNAGGELPMVRLLRVLRITRALVIVRIFRFFRELRMMVFSVLRSGTSLAWSLVLFVLHLFLFSVFFTGQVASFKRDRREEADAPLLKSLDLYFGSMSSAIYTLFMSVTGGISWDEVCAPLHKVHWSNTMVFSFFIFFTLFALTNIITGIFVDTAIQSAQSDRDEVIQTQLYNRHSALQQMQEILQEADMGRGATITLQDLDKLLKDSSIRAHMEALGLQLEEARELFRLLDPKKSGAVAIEEFIFGCMRLKGSARSIDLATLMYENKKMFTMLTSFFDYAEAEFEKMEAMNRVRLCQAPFPQDEGASNVVARASL